MKESATCYLCRRSGKKLMLKGERCLGAKCALVRRTYTPGQHGGTRKRYSKPSEYSRQLTEKQKLRITYGLGERQLRKLLAIAMKHKEIAGDALLSLLERRLDNVVYRLGWAVSRLEARQMISHGKITINQQKVSIASYQVKIDDKINLLSKNKSINRVDLPWWLKSDNQKRQAEIKSLPKTEELPIDINCQQVIEFYSR